MWKRFLRQHRRFDLSKALSNSLDCAQSSNHCGVEAVVASACRRQGVKPRLWKPPAPPAAKPRVTAASPTDDGLFAALDLGTNNCRLLIASASAAGFQIVDSFSRIVRLGEGLAATGKLSPAAIERTIEALKICAERLNVRGVGHQRLIATEACRAAANGSDFIARARQETGLRLEIIDRQMEAELAAAGCSSLMAANAESIILFDIGGGSTEMVWLSAADGGNDIRSRIRSWTSLPVGVVTLAEKHGGHHVSAALYRKMVAEVIELMSSFIRDVDKSRLGKGFHLLGTSGTVTTVAALHLKLTRYDRRRVDGLWMTARDADAVIQKLLATPYDERARNGCIGTERADLVLAGCAIYDAIIEAFPSDKIRIADRGLREGMLMQMMISEGAWQPKPQGSVS
jgi:exopolyphosphatase / guanosine-5'-triphosphate,3'-diphosphate pyrophosphatase